MSEVSEDMNTDFKWRNYRSGAVVIMQIYYNASDKTKQENMEYICIDMTQHIVIVWGETRQYAIRMKGNDICDLENYEDLTKYTLLACQEVKTARRCFLR